MYDAMWRVHELELGWWCMVVVGWCVCGGGGLPLQTLQLLFPNDYLHICKITVVGVILPLDLQQK